MQERWKRCAMSNGRLTIDPANLTHERRLLLTTIKMGSFESGVGYAA
jgi:hypothetical protein